MLSDKERGALGKDVVQMTTHASTRPARNATCVAVLLLALAASLAAPQAQAHRLRPVLATLSVGAGTSYTFELELNAEALLAGIGAQHEDTDLAPQAERYRELRALDPTALASRLRNAGSGLLGATAVRFDASQSRPVLKQVSVPGDVDPAQQRLTTLTLRAAVPPGASSVRVRLDERFGAYALRVLPASGPAPPTQYLKAGEESLTVALGPDAPAPARWQVAWQYLQLGFLHIVPAGPDHVLFVLGIFLLSVRLRPLVWQVTAFTVAHSVTLALAMYGVVSLPSAVVEPLIAASIVYVAVENLLTSNLSRWRIYVVFAFGLLHGLGFAGVLAELGVPPGEQPTALVAFNVGVELGQLAVIAAAFLAVGIWFRHRRWYRAAVVVPGSAAIALVGAWWTVARVI
jgi:hypothetical protein